MRRTLPAPGPHDRSRAVGMSVNRREFALRSPPRLRSRLRCGARRRAPAALVTCDAEARLAVVDLDTYRVVALDRDAARPAVGRARRASRAVVCHTAIGAVSIVDRARGSPRAATASSSRATRRRIPTAARVRHRLGPKRCRRDRCAARPRAGPGAPARLGPPSDDRPRRRPALGRARHRVGARRGRRRRGRFDMPRR